MQTPKSTEYDAFREVTYEVDEVATDAHRSKLDDLDLCGPFLCRVVFAELTSGSAVAIRMVAIMPK